MSLDQVKNIFVLFAPDRDGMVDARYRRGMVVMGGYGHSRLSKWIFGDACTTDVFACHAAQAHKVMVLNRACRFLIGNRPPLPRPLASWPSPERAGSVRRWLRPVGSARRGC
jgi:hypothetical protein